jgi:hypothetical protein
LYPKSTFLDQKIIVFWAKNSQNQPFFAGFLLFFNEKIIFLVVFSIIFDMFCTKMKHYLNSKFKSAQKPDGKPGRVTLISKCGLAGRRFFPS